MRSILDPPHQRACINLTFRGIPWLLHEDNLKNDLSVLLVFSLFYDDVSLLICLHNTWNALYVFCVNTFQV